jgi:hypothetical protein
MKVQLQGLFNFQISFAKHGSGLPYNDKHINGPNEQKWIRECILKDFLSGGQKLTIEEWKNKFYEGYSLYDIKVTDYQKISNRKEIWIIELNK